MPIRINLLAEAKAEEEARRKDPVKKAFLVGIVLVALVLFWSSTLEFKIIVAKSELNRQEATWTAMAKLYEEAKDRHRLFVEAQDRLVALQRYTTNRFLWGTALGALPQVVSGVDDVRVIRLKSEQKYVVSEEAKPPSAPVVPVAKGAPAAKEATATETISMVIDAIDTGVQPGAANVNQFKAAIATVPFFQSHLKKTNGVQLTSLSAPTPGGADRKPFVNFTVQCLFPEKIR